MKEPKTLYSAHLTGRYHRWFKDIARYRGQTMSGLLRQWIRASWSQLPPEAKSSAQEDKSATQDKNVN